MKIEIPIKEVQGFINDYYRIEVKLKNVKQDKIKVTYFGSVLLSVKAVQDDTIVFKYELNEIIELFVEGARFIQKKLVDIESIEWNSKTNEITIDLIKIKQLSGFLRHLYISEIQFEKENILLVLNIRNRI